MNLKNQLIKTYPQNLRPVKGYRIFEEKETVKTMSKGGYILPYFSFCWVVVHFLGSGGYFLAGGGWWWKYFGVDDGGIV